MGLTKAARAKAQAEVSQAESDLATLNLALKRANENLGAARTVGEATDLLTTPSLVHDRTESMREESQVDLSKEQAKVDQLKAQIAATKTRLHTAKKALHAIDDVTGMSG